MVFHLISSTSVCRCLSICSILLKYFSDVQMWLHTNDMPIGNATANFVIYILATGSTLQWLDYLRTAYYCWK